MFSRVYRYLTVSPLQAPDKTTVPQIDLRIDEKDSVRFTRIRIIYSRLTRPILLRGRDWPPTKLCPRPNRHFPPEKSALGQDCGRHCKYSHDAGLWVISGPKGPVNCAKFETKWTCERM